MKAKILISIIITIMLSSQVLAATCGPITTAPGPVTDGTGVTADTATPANTAVKAEETLTVAAGVNALVAPAISLCSDAARVVDTYRQADSTECFDQIADDWNVYSDESDDYLVYLVASSDAAEPKAYMFAINKGTGALTFSNSITPNEGTVYTDVVVTDAENIYAIGNVPGVPNKVKVEEYTSAGAAADADIITEAAAANIYSYMHSTSLAPDGKLVIGFSKAATGGIFVYDPVTDLIADAETYAGAVIESGGVRTTTRDAATDEVSLAFIKDNAGLDTLQQVFITYAAGVLTITTSAELTLPVGFTEYLMLEDYQVFQNGDVFALVKVLMGDGSTQAAGSRTTFAGALTWLYRYTGMSEPRNADLAGDGSSVAVTGFKTLDGTGSVMKVNAATGAKEAGHTGLFNPASVSFVSDYDGTPSIVLGAESFGEPTLYIFDRSITQMRMNAKNRHKAALPPNKAPVTFVSAESFTTTGGEWKMATASDAGFGIQIYGVNPNPDVPEFSLTTLLLATLLAGGLVLFVVRRRFK